MRSYVSQGCVPAPEGKRMLEGELPGTVGDQLDRFLDDLAIAGRSPATVKMYGVKLRAKLPLEVPIYELTAAVCRELVVNELRLNQQSTAHTFHAILRSFTGYLEREGLLAVNPMARVPKPKLPEPQTKALSPEALARLWQAACELDDQIGSGYRQARVDDLDGLDGSGESEADRAGLHGGTGATVAAGLRRQPPFMPAVASDLELQHHPQSTTYRLLFAMLRDTGLRRAEVAGARYDDIEGDVLRVLGKGRKYRRVLLTPEVLGLLAEDNHGRAVRGREHLGWCNCGELVRQRDQNEVLNGEAQSGGEDGDVPMETGRHLQIEDHVVGFHRQNPTIRGPIFGVSPSRVGQLFADIARRAGVRATPHCLRHTWATEFLRSGGQMEAARILGGWSSMAMLTSRYAKSSVEDAALAEARRIASGR